MSKVYNSIKLDFSCSTDVAIPAMQLDKGSRFVRVHLQNNKRSVDVTGTQIVIMAIRHDRQEVIESCCILDASKGIIEFEISEAMTEKQGDVLCQLKVLDNDGVLSSQLFKISVRRSLESQILDNCHCQHYDITLDHIQDIQNQVVVLQNKPDIDDAKESRTTVWSSSKTKEVITSMISNGNSSDNVDLSDYQTKTDQSLNTTNKNVVGAINEVNGSVSEVKQDIDNVNQIINDLKQSVGNGKQLIASAITDMGVPTSVDDSFQTIADHILSIGSLDEKLLSLTFSFENNDMGSSSGIISLKRRHDKYAGIYEIYWANDNNQIYHPYGKILDFDLTNVDHLTKVMNECYVIPKGVTKLIAIRNNQIEALYNIPVNKRISIDKKYSFGLLSDIHVSGGTTDKAESVADFNRAMNYFKNDENVDMVIISGDVTANGLMEDMLKFKELVDSHNVPVHCCRGNHDTYNNCTIDNYKKYIDANGLYYEMTYKGDVYLFLGLAMEDVANPFPDYGLDWLEERLELYKNQRVFLIQHIFVEPTGNPENLYMFNEGLLNTNGTNAKRFIELVKKYRNAVFFSGHSHFDFSLERLNSKANVAKRTESLCHRVHTPSGSRPRQTDIDTPDNPDTVYTNLQGSQGYTVDVYDDFIVLRGIDFQTMELSMIAQYYIDTRPIIFEESVEEVEYPYLSVSEFTTLELGSLEKTGTVKPHTSTRVSEFIPLNNNPNIGFRCNGRIIYFRICYYDDVKTFISYEQFFYNDITSDYHEEFTINKPTGAKYMRFCGQERIEKLEFNGVHIEKTEIPPKPPIVEIPVNQHFPEIDFGIEPQNKYEKAKWKCVNFIKKQLNTSNYSSIIEYKDIIVENELTRPGGQGSIFVKTKLLCGTINSLMNPSIIHNKYISLDDVYDEQYLGIVSGKWHDTLKFPENYRVDVYVITDTAYYVDSCPLNKDHTWQTKRNALRGIKHIELVEINSGLIVEYGRPVVDNYRVQLYSYVDVEYLYDTCKIFIFNGEYYFFSKGDVKGLMLGKVIDIKDSVVGITSEYVNIKHGRLPASYLIPENDPNYDKEGNSALGKHAYLMNSRSFIYDVGLALLVFTCEGEFELCKELIDRMKFEQKEDGSFNFSYDNYIGQLYEDYVRTGSIGWLVWGICYYVLKSNDTSYHELLEKVGQWILSKQVTDPDDIRYGLLLGGRGAYGDNYEYIDTEIQWCSTEHNCSTLQAVKGLYRVLKDEKYNQCATLMGNALINTLYDSENGRFYQGVNLDGVDEAWAIDCLTWAGKTAHAIGRTDIAEQCANQTLNHFSVENGSILVSSDKETYNLTYSLNDGESVSGFMPYYLGYDNPPTLIWSEGTLGAVALFKVLGRNELANKYIDEMIKLQNCNGSTGGLIYTTETRASLPYEFHVWESVVGCCWLYLLLQGDDVLFI